MQNIQRSVNVIKYILFEFQGNDKSLNILHEYSIRLHVSTLALTWIAFWIYAILRPRDLITCDVIIRKLLHNLCISETTSNTLLPW